MTVKVDFSTLTLMDALDLASMIEFEAYQRYKSFAESMGRRLSNDAGAVFELMAVSEKKHGDEIDERRVALFGDTPPRVKLDDVFDVEAPEVGTPRKNMSELKACQLALAAEKKAYAFYDSALPKVTQPEVRALFEELREEEAEHVQMIEAIIARLPPSSRVDLEDLDEDDE